MFIQILNNSIFNFYFVSVCLSHHFLPSPPMRCTRPEGVAEVRCEEPAETSLEAGSGAGEARAGPDTAEGRGKVWAGPEVRGPATMGGAMGELSMELDEEGEEEVGAQVEVVEEARDRHREVLSQGTQTF